MVTINIFDSSVILHHCNDRSLYTNQAIKNSLDFVFSFDEIRSNIDRSQKGNAFTTCGLFNKFPLPNMPGAETLTEWISQRLLESSKEFKNKTATKIEFTRTWANVMFYGCEGSCHSHPLDIDGVAIFYIKAPNNSSELVFINNGIEGSFINQYSESQIRKQKVKEGDLIIHDPLIPHAVSKHLSQESRICFIYEFKYH